MEENQNSNIKSQVQDSNVPPYIQTAPPKPKFKFPILIAIAFVLVLIGTAATIYLFVSKQKPKTQPEKQTVLTSPTSNPTANWKTYTDFRGFSFQYPPDWNFNGSVFENKHLMNNGLGELSIVSTGGLCESCKNLSESKFFNPMFILWKIGDGGAGTTIEKTYESKVGDKRTMVILSHSTDYKDGQPGDKYLGYYIYLNNPKFQVLRLVFYYNDSDKNKDSLLSNFNQILSTLKFFNQNQSDETANWKIYVNDRLGFSFKYPLEWSLDKITDGGLRIISHPPKEPGFLEDFNSIKWYKDYKDVENNTGFRYDSQFKKWGTTVYQDRYAGTGAHFEELNMSTATESGTPIYCLNYEGSSQHLISLPNVYIVMDTSRCIRDYDYPGLEAFLFKVMQSFSVIR